MLTVKSPWLVLVAPYTAMAEPVNVNVAEAPVVLVRLSCYEAADQKLSDVTYCMVFWK
jgi:hypothetical protein